jgi:hypothetical protein
MRYEVYSIDENGNETLFGEYDDPVNALNASLLINGRVKVDLSNDTETEEP